MTEEPHRLSPTEARRIAVRAQLLDRHRPATMHDVVRHLNVLQLDPTKAVAPSADLVLWSRLGADYERAELVEALETGSLVDLQGMARPAEDLALHRAEMAQWPGSGELREWQEDQRDWVRANNACRLDILERLRGDGPLTSADLPDTCVVPWRSSGWTNERNVRRLLEFLVRSGEVASAGWQGRDRLWDLAERVYPDDPVVPVQEARLIRDRRRLTSLGIARARGPECGVEPVEAGDAGEPAVIEGVRGTWRVDPKQMGRSFAGRAALLSPLDRLVHERKRMTEIFGFDYQLEMYKPAAKRRWGYYALPILYGDRLVGKVDATAEHDQGVLRVDAIHQDAPFGRTMNVKIMTEVEDLAHWLELELMLPR